MAQVATGRVGSGGEPWRCGIEGRNLEGMVGTGWLGDPNGLSQP